MNVLLIGYGYWGKKIFSTLNQFRDLNILVYDKKINSISLDDFLVENSNFDYVFIATNEETHYELAKKFLLLNKHVFVEKPLCLNENEARELVDLATKKKLTLFVDYIFLYDNFSKKIKELLNSETIGKVKKVESIRFSSAIIKPNIIVTDDLMIHDLYLMKYFFDIASDELSIESLTNDNSQQMSLIINARESLKIRTSYSWIAEKSKRELTISGEKGEIIWQKNDSFEKLIFTENKKIVLIAVENKYSPLYKSIESFFGRTQKLNQRYNDYITDISFLTKVRSSFYEN